MNKSEVKKLLFYLNFVIYYEILQDKKISSLYIVLNTFAS